MSEKVLYRYNVMNVNSISGFGSIRGGLNADCRDVYFVRLLGVGKGMIDEIKRLDRQMDDYAGRGQVFYKRLEHLPVPASMEEANDYAEGYHKWIAGDKKSIVIKASKDNPALQESLSKACEKTLKLYMKTKKGVTDSILKNYWVKLMHWFDAVFGGNLSNWEVKSNIKIVLPNVWKEQEYLFCYMVTLIGADVLLLQTGKDIELCEELTALSVAERLGDYGRIEIPPYVQNVRTPGPEMRAAVRQTAVQQEPRQNIKITLPPRTPKKPQQTPENVRNSVMPQQASGNVVNPAKPQSSRTNPVVSSTKKPASNEGERREKSFEELALLASSIVMIAIHGTNGDIIGTGSGIIVGRDGFILTNNHVASGGRYYSVRIEDDDQVYTTDEVIKYNSVLDLAVIRIQRRLNPIPVYKGRQKLVRGQKVVAIGSPLGLFNSVSDGIISGFRVIDNVDMIQFTAPTSHGSSGGAVLNMYGEVIGISTAGFDSGQNINLAVGYESINMFIKGFVS